MGALCEEMVVAANPVFGGAVSQLFMLLQYQIQRNVSTSGVRVVS
jgi:hypothetical protein